MRPNAPTVNAEPTVVSPDLSFRLTVDGLLSDMAAEGRAAVSATPSIATTVPVAGMTCRSCEVRIQRFVGRLPNVQHVKASAVRGRVEIESTAGRPGRHREGDPRRRLRDRPHALARESIPTSG